MATSKGRLTYIAPKEQFIMVSNEVITKFDPFVVGIYCKLVKLSSGKSLDMEFISKKIEVSQKRLRKVIVFLEEKGYITREPIKNTEGKFSGWNYQLFAEPVSDKRKTHAGKAKETENGLTQKWTSPQTDKTENGKDNIISNNGIIYNIDEDFKDKEDKESTIVDKKNKRFVKPTIEEIQTYIDEKKLHFEAERFFDYYESKGWLVGKSPMKDWKAACRTWENMRKSERKEDKKKAYDILPDDSDKCQRFKNWMRENHTEQENCLKPLSFDGYMRLQREYGKDEVCFQLDYIDANIGRFLQSDIEASIRLHFKREEQ